LNQATIQETKHSKQQQLDLSSTNEEATHAPRHAGKATANKQMHALLVQKLKCNAHSTGTFFRAVRDQIPARLSELCHAASVAPDSSDMQDTVCPTKSAFGHICACSSPLLMPCCAICNSMPRVLATPIPQSKAGKTQRPSLTVH
jgi:hypothetical protein